ncbi:TonB-dependent receptor [Paraurantiacibacter namhicola]|uniref:TonB-dependent Receptor Plug Domain protein n=1 Tax=Paraurantiacibacter namhicola TaxID=645517 RepID=A0A1C7D7P2_9SPHN|nr:TonB-dependent receptor [Paraurantiacibacter namhicola]ANU07331.1 TonB-dependent Receptor Plug Domain protein [Paraurantiacibacter namhicola]
MLQQSTDEMRPARSTHAFMKAALLASAIAIAPHGAALAQDVGEPDAVDLPPVSEGDEIVVTGEISRTIENSLDAKRALPVIGDAIVGDEIGDLPDLSVAETLERVVGVTSDRFKGGSSELSVRGLGAFLGASYLNGREISSGSDGRDVNYGQFPSELINGAVIYKTQQASFIEGGVSGIIELQTLRPLDYGKRRLQLQFLGGYSPYEDKVRDGEPFNYRITGSYVDQFQLGDGELGIAIGGQIRRDTAPEDFYTSSSTYRPCNTIEGVDNSNNCNFRTDAAGNPTGAANTYFVSNQYIYRAMATQADRDAVIGTLQWKPTSSLDINLDAQYSYRNDVEERGNLVIADGRRDIEPIEISPTGALLAWRGETRLENQSVWRQREETYLGLGGNIAWSGDRLTIAADVSYSQTERRQDEKDMRIRTNQRVFFTVDTRGTTIPNLTFDNVARVESDTGLLFDLDNHDLYDNGARARRRLENIDDDIFAVRLDGQYEMDGFFTSMQAGFRFGERRRVRDDGIDATVALVNGYDSAEAIAARESEFIVEDLYCGSDSQMCGLTFAYWEPNALFRALTGSDDAGLPMGSTLSPDDADVTETTYAGYVQANFSTSIGDIPAYGNIGVRVIRTEIESLGISSAIVTIPGATAGTVELVPTGPTTENIERNSFWNYLPSANLTLEIRDDMLMRFAAYKAIARPDPEAMSAALTFSDDEVVNVGDAVSASGNPFLEPLDSWNVDFSYEWYASPTDSVAVAIYYKRLQTGFDTDISTISLDVNGTATPVTIGRTVNSDRESSLFGFEVAFNHTMDYLPAGLDGLGFQVAYNFADSDFEFPDPTVQNGQPLADFTRPANIPGYSRHSFNGQLFYENGPFTARLAYKWRSQYYKPFRSAANRYGGPEGFLDFSASLNLLDGVQLRFQALNLTDEPALLYRPTRDSLAEASYSGTRYFVGLRARF